MAASPIQAETCPVCGAPIDSNNPLQCAYCGADIIPAGTAASSRGLLPQDICVQLEDLAPDFHLNVRRSVEVTRDGRKGFHMSFSEEGGGMDLQGVAPFTVSSWAYFDATPALAAAWVREWGMTTGVSIVSVGARSSVAGFAPGALSQSFATPFGHFIALYWSIARVALELNAGPSPDYREPLQQKYIDQLLTLARKVNRRAAMVPREG